MRDCGVALVARDDNSVVADDLYVGGAAVDQALGGREPALKSYEFTFVVGRVMTSVRAAALKEPRARGRRLQNSPAGAARSRITTCAAIKVDGEALSGGVVCL